MESRIEALRKVSDFVLETQERNYNEACGKMEDGEPYGHIYIYARILNDWIQELDKKA